jgi:hypothetical protein
MHRNTGHWGRRRTYYMVSLQHWWYYMADDVKLVLQTCVECSCIKASFNTKLQGFRASASRWK